MKTIASILLLALTVSTVPAFADTTINQTHALSAHATLNVNNVAGAVIVHTWNQPEVRITGTLGHNAGKLQISGDANDLTIKIKRPCEHGSGWFQWGDGCSMGPTTMILTVPSGVHLQVQTVSAHIQADGLDGGEIDAKSVSGNIIIDAHSPDMEINSVSGDVHLTGDAGKASVTTVSGEISVARVDHAAIMQSVSGDVHAAGGPLDQASMTSVSGDVYLDGSLTRNATVDLHSMSGDIHLTLSGQPDANLTATSFSGDINSDWGKVVQPQYGPGSSLNTKIGNGDGSITLKSFSGDVDIRQGH